MGDEIFMKSKAYKNTKVDYIKSQVKINQILNKNGIYEIQHTQLDGKFQIAFLKIIEFEGKKTKIGVKIVIPNPCEKDRNQLYRALFYYLKVKFESLTFGFVEEYNEAFVKEFMPYLVLDRSGKSLGETLLVNLDKALENTQEGGQIFLEYKEEPK